jgi:hypothetical protein
MLDGYSKTILTVIAAALVALVLQNAIRPATAQLGGPSSCGETRATACWVRSTDIRF